MLTIPEEEKEIDGTMVEYEDEEVDVSMTSFVDDIGEYLIPKDVDSADYDAQVNTNKLNEALEKVGSSLEESKKVCIARFMGKGAHEATDKYMQPACVSGGKKLPYARHLGAWPQANGGVAIDIQKHCQAMRTGFYAFYGVWSSTKRSFQLKRMFFFSGNRAISWLIRTGTAVYPPTPNQEIRSDSNAIASQTVWRKRMGSKQECTTQTCFCVK